MTRPAAWALTAILLLAGFVASARPAQALTLPPGFHDETVFEGLEEPTTFRFAPDGRVFVAEKSGEILVYDNLEDPHPTVFADLRTEVYDLGDRGILGLALDPDFASNHYVYVLYTYDHLLGEEAPAPKWGQPNQSGDPCPKPGGTGVDDCPVSGRLVRLTAEGDEAAQVGGEPAETVLVEDWCAQFSSHSIGDLQFDSEGNLYASGGDGSDANNVDYGEKGWPEPNMCGDPPAGLGGHEEPPTAEGGALRAQDARTPNPFDLSADPTDLGGSLIRIDPNTGEGLPGNPLYSSSLDPNERRLIAYGFRNPFRFTFDPKTGETYVGNVGWNTWEEIDRVPHVPATPYNSGWPCYEGPGPNPKYQELGLSICEHLYAEPSATTFPFFYYRHDADVVPGDGCSHEGGSAISGMAFYEAGGSFPEKYDGALFFADSVRGCIYVMYPGIDGRPDPLSGETFLSNAGLYPGVDLEIGPEGDLYYAQLFGEGFGPGSIHRIAYDPHAPAAKLTASPHPWGPSPLEVELDASDSTDPDGEPLTYEWDLDGNGSFETKGGETQTRTYAGSENVEVAVKVTNAAEHSGVARLTLYPGDTPPEPTIEEPADSLKWHVGQQIHLFGFAEQEGVKLDASSLFWKTRIKHCPSACHSHPLQVFPATDRGDLTAPDHDYPSEIEVSLIGIDPRGLSATKTVSIQPSTVGLTMLSIPAGLRLGAGPLTQPAPFTLTAIEDGNEVLNAPLTQELEGKNYMFAGWSDGGARTHAVEATANATYAATYTTTESPSPPQTPHTVLAPPAPSAPSRPRLSGHPGKRTYSRVAKFRFSSAAAIGFECSLDRTRFKPCRSPQTYRGLRPGKHVLKVVAVDASGATSGGPTVFHWTVLGPGAGGGRRG